jgi:hypothetical protein
VSGTAAVVVLVALAGVLLLAKSHLIGAAQAMLAVLYLGHVVIAGESTWEALGLVSVGILLVGELSQWSFDSRVVGRYEPRLHRSRATGILALLALGVGVITLAAFAFGLPNLPDPLAVVAAISASLALLVLITKVAREASGQVTEQSDTPANRSDSVTVRRVD